MPNALGLPAGPPPAPQSDRDHGNRRHELRTFGLKFRPFEQSVADTPMTSDEEDALRQHAFKSSALGDNCPTWLKKFTAMQVHTWLLHQRSSLYHRSSIVDYCCCSITVVFGVSE